MLNLNGSSSPSLIQGRSIPRIDPLLDALEQARDRILNQSQDQWGQMQHQAGEFRGQVETYLRETNPTDLSLEQIQQNLERLAHLPESGLLVARAQVKEVRKTAATAAWWLFSTAITAMATAAIAGILAVRGLELFS